jgi:hypothetical protein
MRISIKPHNQAYISDLAQSLECSPAEALNFLLLKIKSEGLAPATAITPIQPVIGFQVPPIEPGYESFQNVMDSQHLQETIDPMIERLISLGVCTEGF